MKNESVKNDILGVGITNEKKGDILKYVIDTIEKTKENFFIVTPNPEIITYSVKHPKFQSILNQARISLCDGVGVIWAGKMVGKPFVERFTGVDFMEKISQEVAEKPITVGFLGGRGGVAGKTADCLKQKYPGLKVSFVAEEWEGFQRKPQMANRIDILFVAFGFPKQEEWMAEHLDEGIFRVAVGVGGAFDYLSGSVPRAPTLMQGLGLEWLYRLIRQPWRWKRQLALFEFIRLVIREKMRG